MFEVALAVVVIPVATYVLLKWRHPLSHVPGPRPLPIIGNTLQLDPKQPHISMHEMAKTYGPVFQLTFEGKPGLVVCDFASIHEVLVSKSGDFAGRSTFYLANVITEGQSGIARTDAGPEVQGRRKLLHKYLRQYGAGMKRIEDITMDATTDMMHDIAKLAGEPVDVREIIFDCTTSIMSTLLIGEPFSEEMAAEANHVSHMSETALARSLSAEIVNQLPFMRHFGNRAYKFIMETIRARNQMLKKWFDRKPENGFINFILQLPEDQKKKFHIAEYREQKHTVLNFYVAGVLTTTTTMTILTNVLCQRPDVQEKLRKEIHDVVGESRPCLSDREKMPYHIATLLEISRYASILWANLPHKAVRDTTLEATGRRIFVPAGTPVHTHLWSMHHNEQLWTNPFHFDPSRFLDSAGRLVESDHPNRKHMMAFSGGHRVCVGEVLAMSRMFLILACMMQTFHILPESTMEVQPSHDPRLLIYGSILTPKKFKVRFQLIQ